MGTEAEMKGETEKVSETLGDAKDQQQKAVEAKMKAGEAEAKAKNLDSQIKDLDSTEKDELKEAEIKQKQVEQEEGHKVDDAKADLERKTQDSQQLETALKMAQDKVDAQRDAVGRMESRENAREKLTAAKQAESKLKAQEKVREASEKKCLNGDCDDEENDEIKKEKAAIAGQKKAILMKETHVTEIRAHLKKEVLKGAKLNAQETKEERKVTDTEAE